MDVRGSLTQHVNPIYLWSRHSGNKSPRVLTKDNFLPTVFPEKHDKGVSVSGSQGNSSIEDLEKVTAHDHRIDMGDEKSDLLGYVIVSGKLSLDKKHSDVNAELGSSKESVNQMGFDAKLTSRALVWSTQSLYLDDIISVSFNNGLRHFTVHAYPKQKKPCGLSCFFKPKRSRKDFRFLAPTSEEALKWVSGFAQLCYVNCLPHPISSKRQDSSVAATDFPLEKYIRCKIPPTVLVILNPRSGRGRSSRVFYNKVEPIFKLAGFNMEVVKTASPGHARKLVSSVDFNSCPDGIICVGGDGIVNEVLNGLLIRNDQKEAISIPIGIIPAGSDNSLVWTVLGVRDPVSAAIAIVKGGLTPTDVFAVEWIQTGVIHFGMTVSYYGFVSDVLELSEKYQKRFGPLRYLVAGVLKFFCLPKYSFEVEYLPAKNTKEVEGDVPENGEHQDSLALSPDTARRSTLMHKASSLSSIESIMTPTKISGDLDTACSSLAGNEPSDYVRGIGSKMKRMSSSRTNTTHEPEEVVHNQLHLSANCTRTRSRSKTDKIWAGLSPTNDSKVCWGGVTGTDKEDISSTVSDPGPIWDAEPKSDIEPKLDEELNFISGLSFREAVTGDPFKQPRLDDLEAGNKAEALQEEEKWVVKKGDFLGVLLCNHACKTVQNWSSQLVAPRAEHDDMALDLILVHGNGRLRLLRFFLLMQFGKHLSLPYVEYVQVKCLRLMPGKNANGCGIDGELLPMNGNVVASLLPTQCRLIGRPQKGRL